VSTHPESVLITGASSGIGWELAKRFAADGSSLILVARRTDKLQELANLLKVSHGTDCLVIGLDLTDPGAPEQLLQKLVSENRQVDVLVNNAGFGQYGRFDEIPLRRHLDMIQLNISALTELTYRVLPQMLARRSGAILNIGSTASFQPGPWSAVYYASKAFVLSFSEGLWKELQGTGVNVSCLCPGPTRTEFGETSQMDQTLIFRVASVGVETVAEAGFQAVRHRRRTVIPGWINKLLAFSVRFTARRIVLDVTTWLQASNKITGAH
jgi:short-subunit dehydrogenase